MNTLTQMIEIIQAYRDRKPIQSRRIYPPENWENCPSPAFNFAEYEYRVTPAVNTVIEVWCNVYGDGSWHCHPSRRIADESASDARVRCVKLVEQS